VSPVQAVVAFIVHLATAHPQVSVVKQLNAGMMVGVATVANHVAMATAARVPPAHAWQVVIVRWCLHRHPTKYQHPQHHQHHYLQVLVEMVARLAVARLLGNAVPPRSLPTMGIAAQVVNGALMVTVARVQQISAHLQAAARQG